MLHVMLCYSWLVVYVYGYYVQHRYPTCPSSFCFSSTVTTYVLHQYVTKHKSSQVSSPSSVFDSQVGLYTVCSNLQSWQFPIYARTYVRTYPGSNILFPLLVAEGKAMSTKVGRDFICVGATYVHAERCNNWRKFRQPGESTYQPTFLLQVLVEQ